MPFRIVRDDITKMKVEAIVSATDGKFSGSGGADGSIRRAAGPGLMAACLGLGGCRPGQAKLTRAFRLPCSYVIHTVGPQWQGGDRGEEEILYACYRSCLELAGSKGIESLAFPLISSGAFGYPKDLALKTAVRAIADFLLDKDMEVYLVVYDRRAYEISRKLFSDIKTYIEDNYVQEQAEKFCLSGLQYRRPWGRGEPGEGALPDGGMSSPAPAAKCPDREELSLEELLSRVDESFSQMLLRKIDEAGISDVQCYKRANIDRKLFSKIRSDLNYRPSKPTAVALAVALELPLEEMKELLGKAGFALSHSSKFDIIVEYFVGRGNYDIFEINEALFAFDQRLLGS